MRIVCASICYRGYAEDEVATTLKLAPPIGYKLMEIHGPLTWSVPAVDAFDLPAMQARIASAGMACAGIYTPGWGGADEHTCHRRLRSFRREPGLRPRHVHGCSAA